MGAMGAMNRRRIFGLLPAPAAAALVSLPGPAPGPAPERWSPPEIMQSPGALEPVEFDWDAYRRSILMDTVRSSPYYIALVKQRVLERLTGPDEVREGYYTVPTIPEGGA